MVVGVRTGKREIGDKRRQIRYSSSEREYDCSTGGWKFDRKSGGQWRYLSHIEKGLIRVSRKTLT